jgi:hypothetical protein
VEYLEIG